MHEGSIARNIIDYVKEESKKNGIKRVDKIVVRLGKLHAVVPDALLFFFDVMKKEELLLVDAKLDLEEEDVVVRCNSCGMEFEPEMNYFVCPYCGSSDTEMIKGGEILIISIEGEE